MGRESIGYIQGSMVDHLVRELFPFFLIVDHNFKILDQGPSLEKLITIGTETQLQDHFSIIRPIGNFSSLEKLAQFDRQLVLLEVKKSQLKMRGQLIFLSEDKLLIAASPWINDPADLQNHNLSFADFSVTDPIIDLMYLIKEQQIANDDIRELLQELENKNKIIEQALVQKNTLMSEIHHRVKNNLQTISSLLSLQSRRAKLPEASKMMESAKTKIDTMALLHQQLYQKQLIDLVEMNKFIEDLISHLNAMFEIPNQTVQFKVEVGQSEIEIDTATAIGLILNEMITNSYQHAFKGLDQPTISISLAPSSDEYWVFEYKDNGPGFSQEAISEQKMGSKLIQLLSAQLNGKLTFEGKNNTYYHLKFPVPPKKFYP